MEGSTAGQSSSSSSELKTMQNTFELNKTLEAAEISPARPSDRKKSSILKEKYNRLKAAGRALISKLSKGAVDPSPQTSKQRKCMVCNQLFRELSAKFHLQGTKKDKYLLLTSIPKRFSIPEVKNLTGCTEYQAKQASKLKNEKGAFSYPISKLGRPMEQTTIDLVREFYLSEENSRASANARDVIYVKDDKTGKKEEVQKRRIYHNLTDLYFDFKNTHAEIKVSIAKFAQLRPKQCVWPGQTGYHNVCVCEIHQNFEFLMDAVSIKEDLKSFLKELACGNDECFLGLCSDCPKKEHFQHYLLPYITEEEEITYMQWVHTDSTEIKTITTAVQEFVVMFEKYIPKILEHEFITRKQNGYIYSLKNERTRQEAAICITVDFAQNYSFVVQNAVQVSSNNISSKDTCVFLFS